MKDLLYRGIKLYIRTALFCYFKAYRIHGLQRLTLKSPTMFLVNHQNALLDALLIAVSSKKPLYFLTRADVFKNNLIGSFFELLRMLPVYRIRDGRQSLSRNEGLFAHCADLLYQNQAILLFPEANHNLNRRVRPLSKGFTRILFNSIERYPALEIDLVAVGVNYLNAACFPDSAAFYFGEPMPLKQLYSSADQRIAAMEIGARLSAAIKRLTTHIPPELPYEETVEQLVGLQADFLDPDQCNRLIAELPNQTTRLPSAVQKARYTPWRILFELINLPLLLIWRLAIKKRISEPEFVSTFRFLYSSIVFPLFYVLLFISGALLFSPLIGLLACVFAFGFNLLYVKLS